MLETRFFWKVRDYKSIEDYQEFIKQNPEIEIISVNLTEHDHVLLTYRRRIQG